MIGQLAQYIYRHNWRNRTYLGNCLIGIKNGWLASLGSGAVKRVEEEVGIKALYIPRNLSVTPPFMLEES